MKQALIVLLGALLYATGILLPMPYPAGRILESVGLFAMLFGIFLTRKRS